MTTGYDNMQIRRSRLSGIWKNSLDHTMSGNEEKSNAQKTHNRQIGANHIRISVIKIFQD